MPKKIDKLKIADEMLDAAIEEYIDNQRYYVAINLAAVAEELYGKYIELHGGSGQTQDLIGSAMDLARKWGDPGPKRKDYLKFAYGTKNGIKHLDDEEDRYMEIDDEKEEAMHMIASALSNHDQLKRPDTDLLGRFLEHAMLAAQKMTEVAK